MTAAVPIAGSRALVTGGAGTIGSHVVDLLVRGGAAEIVVLDNFVRGRQANIAWAVENGPVRVVDGDIRDAALVRELTEARTWSSTSPPSASRSAPRSRAWPTRCSSTARST